VRERGFINYLGTLCDLGYGGRAGENPEVGNVDMAAYARWLKDNYGLTMNYDSAGRVACAPL
jgi:hypothetical protein